MKKSCLIWKDPDAGNDWRLEEKGTTEDEMVGWHYRLDGHEFEWAPGVGDGQGSLECCSPWGRKQSDRTEWLNWTELNWEKNWLLPFSVFFKLQSVQFSCSVVSDFLRPHESQHARPPCLSPTPGVYSKSCPLSHWCHPAISSLSSPSPPAPNASNH